MKQFEENQKIQRQLAIQNHVNPKILSSTKFRFVFFRLNRMKLNQMKRKKKQTRIKQFLKRTLPKMHYRVNSDQFLINIDV